MHGLASDYGARVYRFARLVLAASLMVSTSCKEAPTPTRDAAKSERPTSIKDIEPTKAYVSKDLADVAVNAFPSAADAPVNYSAPIEPLMDLVPSKDGHFVLIRDPTALLGVFDAALQTTAPAMVKRISEGKGARFDELRAVLEGVASFRDALLEVKIDLSKGMLLLEDEQAIIYATGNDDPSALKVALKAAGVDTKSLPPSCVAPPAMPGFAACGEVEAVLLGLTPGKHGKALRTEFEGALKGFDVLRGNAFIRLDASGKPMLASIATPPGEAHLVVGLRDVAPELGKYLEAGRPDALGLLQPEAAFVWGRVAMGAFEEELKSAPGPAQNVAGTLTGEFFMGGLRDARALVGLLGVNDPTIASGVVALASLQKEALQAELPPESLVEVQPIEVGDETVQSLHIKVGLDEAQTKQLESAGVQPEAYGFAAGKYGGVLLGAGADAVKQVAAYKGGTLDSSTPPAGLRRALSKGDAAFAAYLPFDPLQSASVRNLLQQAMLEQDPELARIAPGFDFFSPFSALSFWLTHPADARVLHISVQSFAETSTEEGKAALEALAKVLEGGDAAQIYGALAAAYPDSPRVHRYRVRATKEDAELDPAALSSAFIMGMFAGVTIPAFMDYVDMSRVGGPTPPEPPPALPPPAPPAK